jgi:SPOR domain
VNGREADSRELSMSDYERGPYTPPNDRLAFDPRQPVRGGGPAPVTLIVSALVLAAIVGGVFLVYRHGIRHKGEAPALVGTPVNDIRTAAPPPDAANAAPPGLVIDRTDSLANAAPAFAPPPEQPLPRPAAAAPPPPPPAVTAAPAAVTPKPAPALVVAQAPAPPPAAPRAAIPAAAPPAAKPAPALTISGLADAAVARRPSARPAVAAVAAPPPAAMVAAPVAGWVQIGAFSSAELADKGWHDTARFAPVFMAGKGLKVQSVSVNGKVFFRAFVTGFASHDAAEAFCIKLKAAAKPCIVK